MISFKNFFDSVNKKKLAIFSAFAVATCTAAFSIAKGNSESLDLMSSENDSAAADQKLTSEEIDKIIEDLKVSGNVDNIIDKLNEYLIRARLAENDALADIANSPCKVTCPAYTSPNIVLNSACIKLSVFKTPGVINVSRSSSSS